MEEKPVRLYYVPEQTIQATEVRDAFAYRPERGWRWLQRLCLWVLRWLSCYYERKEVKMKYVTLRTDKILELVRETKLVAWRRHLEPRYLIVGQRQFYELIHESEEEGDYTYFRASLPNMGHEHHTAYGLEIIRVPWFDGVVLLPELTNVND